jgi:hypothetical protein
MEWAAVHAIDDATVTTTRQTGPVRHSSAGGINRQAQRRRSSGVARDVLARIADHAIHRLDQLLPWNWKTRAARLAA